MILFLLLLLIPLLSGCVKIENTLDISNIDSINNVLKVESKYVEKYPWQLDFEKKIIDLIPNSEVSKSKFNFSLENKNLNFTTAKDILYKIQKLAGELAGGKTYFQMNVIEKNFFFLKKYNYEIDLDLRNLPEIDNLEINFKIINPDKAIIQDKNSNLIKTNQNIIMCSLIPGEFNILKFSFWQWNFFLLGLLLITLTVSMAYLVRFYRYQIGSELPQLPSR